MKLLKVLNVTGRILFAGLLIIGHIIMGVIGLIICAVTSQKKFAGDIKINPKKRTRRTAVVRLLRKY